MLDKPLLVVIIVLLTVVAAPVVGTAVTDGSQAGHLSGEAPDDEHRATVDELTLTGVSFDIDLDQAQLQSAAVNGASIDLMLEDASVRLENATVTLEGATITETGSIAMEEGSVTLERGTLKITSGTFTMPDGRSVTVEDRTIVVSDASRSVGDESGEVLFVTREPLGMSDVDLDVDADDVRQALASASIESASVTGVDASAGLESALLDGTSVDERTLDDVTAAAEDAGVTIKGVSADGNMVTIDRLVLEVDEDDESAMMAMVALAHRSSMVDEASWSADHHRVTLEGVTVSKEGLLALLGVDA